MYTAYNECMDHSQDLQEFAVKSKGMLTDHAEDQKKLVRLFTEWKWTCEREVRGERALASLPLDDITHIIDCMMECIIATAGGIKGWDALSLDEQHRCTEAAHQQLHVHVGEEHFAALTDAEKEAVDFLSRLAAHKYLHGKAQELDSNGAKRKQRKAQVEYHQKLMKKNCEIDQQRKEWKDAATAKLHAVVPCLHREFDPHVPQNKDMPKQKEDKLKVLREAIVCYTSGEVTRQETTQEVPLETGKSEDEEP
ncbi:hypothetical protein F4604DRAFT_1924926 [Suillus subluteus]|nr:hypothetical protein F4604DRAFT_1924926 [Suillus subluteus]